jgi:hypothetical protein
VQRAGAEGFEGLEGQVGEEPGGEAGTGAWKTKLLDFVLKIVRAETGSNQSAASMFLEPLRQPTKGLMRAIVELLNTNRLNANRLNAIRLNAIREMVGEESPEGSPAQAPAANEP